MGLDGGGRYPSILGGLPEETASPGHSWTPVVRIRNQQVGGSSPLAGSITTLRFVSNLAALPFCTSAVSDSLPSRDFADAGMGWKRFRPGVKPIPS